MASAAMESDADLRLLAVFCNAEEDDPGYDPPGPGSTPTFVSTRPGVQVELMEAPSMQELAAKLASFKPTMLYVRGSPGVTPDSVKGHVLPIYIANGPDKLAEHADIMAALEEVPLDTAYLDAAAQEKLAELLRLKGVPNVILWAEDPPALHAAHFAGAFFGALSVPRVTTVEAYTMALHAVQALCGTKHDGRIAMPPLPDLLIGPPPPVPIIDAPAAAADEAAELAFPEPDTVPPPHLPGVDAAKDLADAVPGWESTRLIAPRADARLSLVGGTPLLDASRLGYLGEALRGLLVAEARVATLEASEPLDPVPAAVEDASPGGAGAARRCRVRTASGATAHVVVAGAESVLSNAAALQHALRQTLAADALSLQFRLPPVGTPLPLPHAAEGALDGVPVVDAIVTNVGLWAVHVLRQLALDPKCTALLGMGVAAVGSAAVARASAPEVLRRKAIVLGVRPPDAAAVVGGGAGLGGPSANPLAVPADPPLPPHCCGRAPITEVTEEEFLDDLAAFISQRRNKPVDRARFPDAALNGAPLDALALYREVVTRGGFRVGAAINWKGSVFAKMRNWAPDNRQTGVGAALKRHYAALLWEYEQAHPADVLSDRCVICGSGEEQGLTDWIACDSCESWVHFSCDKRQGLGTFAMYSGDSGRTYTCPACTRGRLPGDRGGSGDEGDDDGGGGGGDDDGDGEPMES